MTSNSWKDEEVYKLIELWGEDTIQTQLEGCKHNREVYERIAKAMKEAGYNKNAEQCRDKAKKLKSEYRKVRDKNKITGNKRKTWKFMEVLDEVLGDRPATKPPIVIDTSSENQDENDSDKTNDDSIGDGSLEDTTDTVSIAGTDTTSTSEGKSKNEVKEVKRISKKKRGREDRLQSIMGGIVNQILESQEKSDERYFELEEKQMKLEQEDKEREERMKKDEMDFQLRMMSMITQAHASNSLYPCTTPYSTPYYQHNDHQSTS